MNRVERLKLATVMATTAITIGSMSVNPMLRNDSEVLNRQIAYTTYNTNRIYIVTSEELENIHPQLGDIIILDERAEKNNMKIYSSYRIKDLKTQNEILKVIEEYERDNPSDWNRSIQSMRIEWLVHNVLYGMCYEMDRTRDVDFENSEENLYGNKVLKNIMKY